MTHEEILNKFKNKYPSAKVNDFRPICHKEFTDGKQGITIWLDNGDVIEYYPRDTKLLRRIQNKSAAVDKLTKDTYTKDEVVKIMNEAVYW